MIIELAPAAPQDSLTRAEKVVGQAEPRRIVKYTIRKPRKRYFAVLLVPIKASTGNLRRTRNVQGRIPNGEADTLPVVPPAQM